MLPDRIIFNGYKFRLSGTYYRRNNWASKGPSNLHRAIWEFHNGAIPVGYDIHHSDGNTLNNDIGNLRQIERSEHQRIHAFERIKEGSLKPPSRETLRLAAQWHSSEAGKKWHSEHGKQSWVARESKDCLCENCGKGFESPFPTRAKFCSQKCKIDKRTKSKGGIPRSERKPVECACQECSQRFMSLNPERAKYCHQNCGVQAHRRRQGKAVGVRPYRQKERLLSSERIVGE